jgi:hypothetical protein
LVEIITIELPKVPDTDDGDPVWPFLRFFKCREEEDFSMLVDKYQQVRGAFQALREISMSPYARRVADARQRERWAQEAREKDRYNEGISIGEGRERAKAEAERARADEAEGRNLELERRIRELERTNNEQ